ncbi:2'-5' RNA ligase family protein [Micromonospora sp. NBC_00421]|uniref:2'-5' RNA ligase family protein n=1 Tax=Micromonospora sp. NBC_00421 TaxID=2975976 RepID=UPI002E1E5F48
MSDTVKLVRRDGVELVRAGSWALSSGRWDASPADLAAAVAAQQCPAIRRPVLWIGHTDSRFTPRASTDGGDGEPAIGWVENLRLVDGGHTLIGDYVGVPAWLDQVMASAYPDRSVEGAYNRRCQLGHTHPFVLDGVALLGVTRPGVGTLTSLQSLADVRALYGLAASADAPEGEVRISIRITAAEPAQHTGAMVALIPTEADAARLAVDGGEAADELHVTLMYLGEASQIPDKARNRLVDAISRATTGFPPVDADGFALSVFNPGRADRDTCVVLGVSGEYVADAQYLCRTTVRDVQAETLLELPAQHEPWVAHLTLAYTDDLTKLAALTDRVGPIRFDRVRVVFGGDRTDIPLTSTDDSYQYDSIPFARDDGMVAAADGSDENRLKRYWTKDPEGLAKWRDKPHPWRALFSYLKKFMDPVKAKRVTSAWYRDVFGHMPNQKKTASAGQGADMPNPQPDAADRIKAAWNATAPVQQYIVQVRASDVIVMDDTDRTTLAVPVTVDGDTVTFGEPRKVALDYVPAEQVAASVAVYASRDESRPAPPPVTPLHSLPAGRDNTPEVTAGEPNPVPPPEPAAAPAPEPPAAEPETAPSTDPKGEDPVSTLSTDVRSRLGLTEDADDTAILAALDALKTKADEQPNPEQVAASAARDDEMKAEIARLSGELARINASAAADTKKNLFDGAVAAGKLKPADREGWEARYDRAPEVITEILASIAPNTAVPVAASGYTGGDDTTNPVDVPDDIAGLFSTPFSKEA